MSEAPDPIDWTIAIQHAIIADLDDVDDADVYCDVDPQRRFEGKTIIEVGLQNVDCQTFIDGDFRRSFNYTVFIRAKGYAEALERATHIANYVVKRYLTQQKVAGEIDSYIVQNVGVETDVIEKTSGASFTGYLQFRILEPIRVF